MPGEAIQNESPQIQIDNWEAAFAALGKEEQANTEEPAATTGDDGTEPGTEGIDGNQGVAVPEAGNDEQAEIGFGGTGDDRGADIGEDGFPDNNVFDIDDTDIESYKKELMESIETQVLQDVAAAYIKQGARHTNGQLGATINDSDICKRDSDGVPHYYNPETGREFTGDNPRRQAQEWCDDYNRELADAFNKTCEGYSKRLLDERGAGIAVIEFAATYKKLDPMRRSMFDAVIEDYEIADDNGNVIGYSIDLNKALAAVNRQIKTIQERFSKKQSTATEPIASSPAIDIPASGSTSTVNNGKPNFKSIAEAMEWQQDQLIAKMKGNN